MSQSAMLISLKPALCCRLVIYSLCLCLFLHLPPLQSVASYILETLKKNSRLLSVEAVDIFISIFLYLINEWMCSWLQISLLTQNRFHVVAVLHWHCTKITWLCHDRLDCLTSEQHCESDTKTWCSISNSILHTIPTGIREIHYHHNKICIDVCIDVSVLLKCFLTIQTVGIVCNHLTTMVTFLSMNVVTGIKPHVEDLRQ